MVPQAVLLAVAVAMASAMVYLFDAFLKAGKAIEDLEGKVVLKADLDKRVKTLTDDISTSASSVLTRASAKVGTRFDELQAQNALVIGKAKDETEAAHKAFSNEIKSSLADVQKEVGVQGARSVEIEKALRAEMTGLRNESAEAGKKVDAQLKTELAAFEESASVGFNDLRNFTDVRVAEAMARIAKHEELVSRFEHTPTGPVKVCDVADGIRSCRAIAVRDDAAGS